MAAITAPPISETEIIELNNGDRMTQKEFHRVYSRMRRAIRAELIRGIVYMASPLKVGHGTHHNLLGTMFGIYSGNSPGVECGDNTTIILGDDYEPQPDLYLRILPECGGQSRTTVDDYVDGPPELVAEVATSSYAIDLHTKREDYAAHGVLEYLVLNVRDARIHWYDLRAGNEYAQGLDCILRIRSFPGLWLNGPALLANDFQNALSTLAQGLATAEHKEFIQRLGAARRSSS